MKHSKTFSDALQLYVGVGKRTTVADLAGASGVSERCIHAYRGGDTPPGWDRALEILRVMPSSFAAMVLRDAGIVGVQKAEDSDPCTFKVNEAVADQIGKLGRYLKDGRFDHQEEAELERDLPELITVCQAWLSARGEKRAGVTRIPHKGSVGP